MAADETTAEKSTTETVPTAQRKNIISLLRAWPVGRKISLAVMVLLCVIVFAVLIIQGRTADYQLLYANLTAADAGSVVAWLRAQHIPYQLKNQGRNIWISADRIYETRLDLAANDLPTGGSVGFEVFDKQSFALTDYVQKVNYTRALQGELARTITSLAPVVSTRVHLALPERRLFKNQQKTPTASVILSLANGQALDESQVQGIIHLVAGSVSGLPLENVKVIDSNGVVLESAERKERGHLLSVDMLSYQQNVEHRLEIRAQELLDRIMGKNKAMVRVTAALDFAKVESTHELFDADEPVIRSEQINQEASGSQTSGGIPGVQSNLQGASGALNATSTPSNKSSRTTNYEISKTVSKTINPVGSIKNLSVSILVADRQTRDEEGKVTGTTQLSEAELQSIEQMVASALGIIAQRGDVITVVSMPFSESPVDELLTAPVPRHFLYEFLPAVKLLIIALALVLFYFILLRPIIKTMRGEVVEHYKTVEALERERNELLRTQLEEEGELPLQDEDFVTQLRKEVVQNPTPTAYIIKNWLQEA